MPQVLQHVPQCPPVQSKLSLSLSCQPHAVHVCFPLSGGQPCIAGLLVQKPFPCCCAGDRPYLISGADDKLAKVWDYQTKACVQTLEGHGHNVSAVCFHPELPIIITGSEDGSVKFWHSTTYRLESTLNYGLERLWALGACKGSNQ